MAGKLDVIAFGPHPDDAEAACGGLLLKLVRLGYRVAICDLTRGEMASNGTPEQRAAEADEAAKVLELHERLNLGLPDGGLQAGDPQQLDAVVRLLRQRSPRLILAPHEASRHPDHKAACELVRRAQFFCGVGGYDRATAAIRRPVLLRGQDFYPMQASFVVPIDDELERKMQALRCYRSQFERRPGDAATLLNDPAYLQRIEANAFAYGQLVGHQAAEPFAIDGSVSIDDPISHLGQPGSEVEA